MFKLVCNDAAHKHGTNAFLYGNFPQKFNAFCAAEKFGLTHFTISNNGISHQYDLAEGWRAKQFRNDWQ